MNAPNLANLTVAQPNTRQLYQGKTIDRWRLQIKGGEEAEGKTLNNRQEEGAAAGLAKQGDGVWRLNNPRKHTHTHKKTLHVFFTVCLHRPTIISHQELPQTCRMSLFKREKEEEKQCILNTALKLCFPIWILQSDDC